MAKRFYQKEIYNAILNKDSWVGNKTWVETADGVTKVRYYLTTIAVINHVKKSVVINDGGYTNASTNARINAVKEACKELEYKFCEG